MAPPTRRGFQHAEGLVRIAQAFLADTPDNTSGTARAARPSCQVIIDIATLTGDAPPHDPMSPDQVGSATDVLWWRLAGGRHRLSKVTAEALACDAFLIPVLTDGSDVPIAVGDAQALIPTPVRRAARARDQSCRMPGRGAAADWTDLHHLLPRVRGGATALSNLISLCRRCHLMVHRRGWHLTLAPDGTLTVQRGRYRFTSRPRLRPPRPTRRPHQAGHTDLPF